MSVGSDAGDWAIPPSGDTLNKMWAVRQIGAGRLLTGKPGAI